MSTQWTFLIYLAADNALYEDAQISLRQITEASRFTDLPILVHFDGPTAARSSRYACAHGARKLVWEAAPGYTSDRAARLSDFLNFALDSAFDSGFAQRFAHGSTGPASPASRIFLVLWGHGAGLDHVYLYSDPKPSQLTTAPPTPAPNPPARPVPIHALDLLNSDDAHANRYVGNVQLSSVLGAFSARLGRKIDILGFDACLMGMAEICHELAASVSLLIASDEEIPMQSWPYNTILGDLVRFPGIGPAALSAVTVSRFIEAYATPRSHTRISLSALDLSACQPLSSAIRSFVQELSTSAADPARRATILHARDFSRTPDVHDYIDLAVFCQEIACSFPDDSPLHLAATTVSAQLTQLPLILYHRDAGENGAITPYGLAIYFPQSLPPTYKQLQAAASASDGLQLYSPLSGPGTSAAPLLAGANSSASFSLGNSVSKTVGDGTKTVGDGTKTVGDGSKTVGDGTKTVGDGTKTVGDGTKTVGDGTKHISGRGQRDLASGRRVQRQLIGSEVLWDSYIRLQFNADTGWAALLAQLLSGTVSAPDPDAVLQPHSQP